MAKDVGNRVTTGIVAEGVAQAIAREDAALKPNINIIDYKVSSASAKGENFACVINSVEVEAEVKKKEVIEADVKEADGKKAVTRRRHFRFISKECPMSAALSKFVVQSKSFLKEVLAYSTILPAWQSLMKPGQKLRVPECYYASNESLVMLLEDLRESGHVMADKRRSLDKEHVLLVLDAMALFHAVSFHWTRSYPAGGEDACLRDFQDFYHEGQMYVEDEEQQALHAEFIKQIFLAAAAMVAQGDPSLGRRMQEAASRGLLGKLRAATKPEGFCVFIHGDFWTNNFMFQYDSSGKPTSLALLDFQIMRYARPAQDLTYFFHASVDFSEFGQDGESFLMKYYHEAFVKQMKVFGCDEAVFPYEALVQQYKDVAQYGFIFGVFVTQLMLSQTMTQEGGSFDLEKMAAAEGGAEALAAFASTAAAQERGNTALVAAPSHAGSPRPPERAYLAASP